MRKVHGDLPRIERLRGLFLDDARGEKSLPDYWRNAEDLDAYDRVLAARIGWKWNAALAECAARGWAPSGGELVVDFGCGSGIASRRYVEQFGAQRIVVHDRSALAMAHARRSIAASCPGVDVAAATSLDALEPDVLLVSHVLSELDAAGLGSLRTLIDRSRRVLLVESGNRTAARRLSELRDALLGEFQIVAPCPHGNSCPALARDRDWCHFFAEPPQVVFTESFWAYVARDLGVDLRSLPYAFVALDRSPVTAEDSAPANRVLGRPRLNKHEARVQLCTSDGLQAASVAKRTRPVLWKRLKKDPAEVRSIDLE